MAPHTINTTIADRQLESAIFIKTGSYLQTIINANTNKY